MVDLSTLDQLIDSTLALRARWGVAVDIGLALVVTIVADLATRFVFGWLAHRVRHTPNIWDDALYYSIKGPLQGLIWLGGLAYLVHVLWPEGAQPWLGYWRQLRGVMLVLLFTWFAFRLIRSVGANALARAASDDNLIDTTTADAMGKLLRVLVLAGAGVLLLDVFGVPPSGLLAFSGIGGIALGFAARDLLANLFGGLTIYLNRPFSVGDWIRSPDRDIEGVVTAIGWRATTVQRFDMRPLYVPNAIFSNVALENPSRMSHRRIIETVPIRYEDAALIPEIVQQVRQLLDADEAIDSDQIILTYLDSLGESALQLLVYCYTTTTDWAQYQAIKQSVLQRVQDTVRANGAAIALPTRTMHVPGELVVTGARSAASQTQQAIDEDKVQSEREDMIEQQRTHGHDTHGPDNPTEQGQT